MTSRRHDGGFTLAELLVVVMLVIFAATFALPSVHRSRVKGQAAVCLTNQKSIHEGLHNYVLGHSEKRLPPLHIEGALTKVPRVFDVANYVHSPDVESDLVDARNWADVLFDGKLVGMPTFDCVGDYSPVPGVFGKAKLSYGLNVYFYDQKVDGWGGSTRGKATQTYHSAGGKGDAGFGFYGPKVETIKSPDKTILLGDRKRGGGIIGTGAGIGYHWARYALDMHRHGTLLPLTFNDGHGDVTTYEQLWGPLGGKYRPDQSLMTHVNLDFYVPRMNSLPHPRPNPHGAGSIEGFGGSGPWTHGSYKAIHPVFDQSLAGACAVESVLMPFWQGWEMQPFLWK